MSAIAEITRKPAFVGTASAGPICEPTWPLPRSARFDPARVRTLYPRAGEATAHTQLRLEQLAFRAATVAPSRQAMLGLLLSTTLPLSSGLTPILRPLWAGEAMQRAYDLVWLIAAMERAAPSAKVGIAGLAAERNLASEIADAYRSLNYVQPTSSMPCSDVLRTTVRDLVELFGRANRSPDMCTEIERLALPMYQRRALVLAASRLVACVLCHAAQPAREIVVRLIRVAPRAVRMTVSCDSDALGTPDDIVTDLASLLACTPKCVSRDAASTATEIMFEA